jgi:hypothetical protein
LKERGRENEEGRTCEEVNFSGSISSLIALSFRLLKMMMTRRRQRRD